MESVINVVEGDTLELNKDCIYCDKTATNIIIATINRKYNGILTKNIYVCKEHYDKINALFSGEYNIDNIFLEKYRKNRSNLNFRK